jgi:uncharacterized membrane protein (DUF2068 family)
VSAPPPAEGPPDDAAARPAQPDRALRVIAVYKFLKAALMVALAFGTLRLLRPDVAAWVDNWAAQLSLRHDRRLLGQFISMISGLSNRRLHELALGAFGVALLFITEGVGLWMGKRWAEYLTVIATTLFVPFEIVQLVRLPTVTRAAALLVNLAVAAFLVYRLRRPGLPQPT